MKEPQILAILLDLSGVVSGASPDFSQKTLKRLKQIEGNIPVYSMGKSLASVELLSGTQEEALRKVFSRHRSSGEKDASFDTILLVEGLLPFFDETLYRQARQDHIQVLADYTLGENIPPGILPDFVSRVFLENVPEGKAGKDLRGFSLKHLNDYEIELFYRLPDLRQIRLDFSCRNERSFRLVEDIQKIRNEIPFENWPDFFRENPEVLRPAPSYLEIELTTAGGMEPVFFPTFIPDQILKKSLLKKLISGADTVCLPEDLTIALGGRGEIALHPDLLEILEELLSSRTVQRIYLETWGIGWSRELLEEIHRLEGNRKLHMIWRLPSLKKDRYQKLTGMDRFDEVRANMEQATAVQDDSPGMTHYVEIYRILDVEDEIDDFYKSFEGTPFQVLMQKFNSYIGLLPERRVSDLTPLHRDFCWHLARDLFINAGGRIVFCKQDPEGKKGSLDAGEAFELLWANNAEAFRKSFRGELNSLPLACEKCDEWYTFNG